MTEQERFAVPTLPPASTPVQAPPAGTPLAPPAETPFTPPVTNNAPPSVAPLPTLPGHNAPPSIPAPGTPVPVADVPVSEHASLQVSAPPVSALNDSPLSAPTLPSAASLAPAPTAPAVPTAPLAIATPAPPLPPCAPAAPAAAPSGEHFDKYGMPVGNPDGPKTEANWKKKRKKSPLRKLFGFIVMLAILGGIGYGAFLGYQQLAPEVAPTTLPLDDPDTLIGRSNELTDQINENSEEIEALDQLGLDPTGEAATAPAAVVQSYSFLWSDPTGQQFQISVDTETQNFTMTDGTLSVRRIEGEVFAQQAADGPWSAATLPSELAVVGLAGPLTLGAVTPDSIAAWITQGSEVATGRLQYQIDEARLALDAPDVWQAYLSPWGLTDEALALSAPGRDLELLVQVEPDGQVVLVEMNSPSIGGTVTYTLTSMSAAPLVVENPTTGS